MRNFVGFARADEVERYRWGRYSYLVEEQLDDFERYLVDVRGLDEIDALDVRIKVEYLVKYVGFVPRPHEVERYHREFLEGLSKNPFVLEAMEQKTGVSAGEWIEFFRGRARDWSRAVRLYWSWRGEVDG